MSSYFIDAENSFQKKKNPPPLEFHTKKDFVCEQENTNVKVKAFIFGFMILVQGKLTGNTKLEYSP